MKILAIETSCDETAITILEAQGDTADIQFTVQGNALYSQAQMHARYGGVYPNLAKRAHAENAVPLLKTALTEARLLVSGTSKLRIEEIDFLNATLIREPELLKNITLFATAYEKPPVDAIAVTHGPGLEPALWVGVNFARALAYLWHLPIIPVNHLEGHLVASACRATKDTSNSFSLVDIKFPLLGLIVSGGHTEFVYATSWGSYEILGKTRDDSIGEAFDKVARMLDIPYPGGAELSRLAQQGRSLLVTRPAHLLKEKPTFPRPMLKSPDLDFSFSGLKTAVLYKTQSLGTLSDIQRVLFATEFEDAIVEVVCEKVRNALNKHTVLTFLLGGGVSANIYVRARLESLITKEFPDTSILMPEQQLSTDNAVMIGMAAYLQHLGKNPTVSATEPLSADGTLGL